MTTTTTTTTKPATFTPATTKVSIRPRNRPPHRLSGAGKAIPAIFPALCRSLALRAAGVALDVLCNARSRYGTDDASYLAKRIGVRIMEIPRAEWGWPAYVRVTDHVRYVFVADDMQAAERESVVRGGIVLDVMAVAVGWAVLRDQQRWVFVDVVDAVMRAFDAVPVRASKKARRAELARTFRTVGPKRAPSSPTWLPAAAVTRTA